MANILDLPPELIEQILLELDPLHIATVAQTCKGLHSLIYDSPDELLWRILYLTQPLDDPRTCLDELGFPAPFLRWRPRLERIIRARTVIKDPSKCQPGEREAILHTLMELAACTPPISSPESDGISLNFAWLATKLRSSAFLDAAIWGAPDVSPDERQLLARLHTMYGLTARDYKPRALKESREYVYAMRNYRWDNDFGPFMMDGSGRVNWVHVRAIHHIMSMHVVTISGDDVDEPYAFTIYPMSFPFCQSIIPRGIDLNAVEDWAGLAGVWQCAFCFCDHRELLVYNNMNESPTGPLNPSIFDAPDFVEVFRQIHVALTVTGVEPDPAQPHRPRLRFVGEINNEATMIGSVWVTPDGQVRWQFKSGEQGNAIWSSEGVQVGGVRSSFGVLGAWTTVHHDRHDPVGPFWLRKVSAPDDTAELDENMDEE